ncbi:hypothetical protein AVEN_206675-1 [Araneus ventricosus]|uniref:Uncharacterized protein n=1 Tax=Araneus ventricosus TaxID=182803 RepID=A0A4Y2WER0_ARAVE|nr:hypothetical protein AVEN_206675-1 [Araneus ventricosus]
MAAGAADKFCGSFRHISESTLSLKKKKHSHSFSGEQNIKPFPSRENVKNNVWDGLQICTHTSWNIHNPDEICGMALCTPFSHGAIDGWIEFPTTWQGQVKRCVTEVMIPPIWTKKILIKKHIFHTKIQIKIVTITFCLALLPVDGAAKTFDFPEKNERESDLSLRARTLAVFLSRDEQISPCLASCIYVM